MYAVAVQQRKLGKLGAGEQAAWINPAIMAGTAITTQVISYWRQQSLNNANKVKATKEANGFVAIFYGAQSTACAIEVNGTAVWQYKEPQNYLSSLTALPVSSYRFCESSVGGLIERCRIQEAVALLTFAAQDAQTLAHDFYQYFGPWFYQYGMADIAFLNTKLTDAARMCAAGGIDTLTGQQTNVGPGNTGDSPLPTSDNLQLYLLLGAGAFLTYGLVSD